MRLFVRLIALIALGAPAALVSQATAAPKSKPAPPAKSSLPSPLPVKFSGPPTVGDIRALDLMTRLYRFADDSMMGRLAGTKYNDMGTDFIAHEVQRLGLLPAGDSGTYFQHPLVQDELAPGATLSAAGTSYEVWTQFVPRFQGRLARPFDGDTAVFGGTFGDTATYLPAEKAAGRIVVIRAGRGPDGTPNHFVINRGQLSRRYANAAAIFVASAELIPPQYLQAVYMTPAAFEKTDADTTPVPSYLYITLPAARAILGVDIDSAKTGLLGGIVHGSAEFKESVAPGRNVVAILRGSDPTLRGQYVAIGAHNDHIGFSHEPVDHDSIYALMHVAAPRGADEDSVKPTEAQWVRINALKDSLRSAHGPRLDSVYNGADDDGSGSMSVLEIAERFATAKKAPKRSILFVWHTGEELGLLGSEYFTDHPTVPRDSIVAQLNMDMVGRGAATDVTGLTKEGAPIYGGAGFVQLFGGRRLSTELGDLADSVNARNKLGLKFNLQMDVNGHPANIYCRSDHYEYARYGIPIIFFTTGIHADYHQLTDEPQYIDYERMAQISRLVYQLALTIADLDHRLVVDQPKPDPKGVCRQ